MTCTKTNRLALHKVLPVKLFYNLRSYICDESHYPFLSLLSFSFWVFIHHWSYDNRMTSYYRNGCVTSGKSVTYQFLFELS